MKIRKVAVGNAAEAFIEGNFTNGVNIISSDDNNKGKTIVIQSMMYALGNEPTFPTSFEFQKYYYYIEFEEAGIIFKLCRSGDGFVLKRIVPLTIVEQKFKFRIELHPCAFESGGDELCTVPNALNKFIRFGQ